MHSEEKTGARVTKFATFLVFWSVLTLSARTFSAECPFGKITSLASEQTIVTAEEYRTSEVPPPYPLDGIKKTFQADPVLSRRLSKEEIEALAKQMFGLNVLRPARDIVNNFLAAKDIVTQETKPQNAKPSVFSPDVISRNAVELWSTIQERASQHAQSHPNDRLNFSFAEAEPTVQYMKEKLLFAKNSFQDKNKLPEAEIAENLLKETKSILNSGIPYSKLIRLSYFFSNLMDHRVALETGRTPIHSTDSIKRRLEQPFDLFDDLSFQRSYQDLLDAGPQHLIVPIIGDVGIGDFLRVRGIPVYFAGITAVPLTADGIDFMPSHFFAHDLSHAKLMFDADQSQPRLNSTTARDSVEKIAKLRSQLKGKADGEPLKTAVDFVLFEYFHEYGSNEAELWKTLPPHFKENIFAIPKRLQDGQYGKTDLFGPNPDATIAQAFTLFQNARIEKKREMRKASGAKSEVDQIQKNILVEIARQRRNSKVEPEKAKASISNLFYSDPFLLSQIENPAIAENLIKEILSPANRARPISIVIQDYFDGF